MSVNSSFNYKTATNLAKYADYAKNIKLNHHDPRLKYEYDS